MKAIKLAGRSFRIGGRPGDPYFDNVEAVAEGLAPLEAWLRSNLNQDATVIDAGANLGITTLLMSEVFPSGHVHAFEANSTNFEHLRQNIALNGVDNCIINPVALGSQEGRIRMEGSGSASYVSTRRPLAEAGAIDTTPMTTLDAYVTTAQLARVDLVKIDVEGFEPAVLAGARAVIDRFRPPIMMEFNSWCLTYIHGFHPRAFAEALWDAFDVRTLDSAGAEAPASGGNIMRFLYNNMVLHGAVDDLILRIKPGETAPALDFSPSFRPFVGWATNPAANATVRIARPISLEIDRLQRELAGVYRSTSWRLTAPLRSIVRLLRPKP